MTDKEYYAHSREGKPPKYWHRLEDHLMGVAEMARGVANAPLFMALLFR